MAVVDEQNLSDLVESRAIALYEAQSNLPVQSIDLVEEERKKSFLKIIQLKNLWKNVYEKFIQRAIWPSDREQNDQQDTLQQLVELIKIFDSEMIALSGVITDQQATITRLERLLETVQEGIEPGIELSQKQLGRRRSKIRKASKEVMKSFEAMESKIVTPGLLRRQLVWLWGGATIEIDPEVQQRLGALVGSSMRGISRDVGAKLRIPPETIEAFSILELPVWSSKQEMQERYRYLIRQHHPDIEGGSKEMASRLTGARDTLISHYSTASG